jgi:hypothetical protein
MKCVSACSVYCGQVQTIYSLKTIKNKFYMVINDYIEFTHINLCELTQAFTKISPKPIHSKSLNDLSIKDLEGRFQDMKKVMACITIIQSDCGEYKHNLGAAIGSKRSKSSPKEGKKSYKELSQANADLSARLEALEIRLKGS